MLKAKRILESAQSVYVACHTVPDGDAIGSLFGLGLALRRLGKACTLACPDPVPAKYDFLAGLGAVVAHPPTTEQVIVTLDCSDLQRLGALYDKAVFDSRPVINVDHHRTNLCFGTINVVHDLPSTAEIVYELIRKLRVPLDRDIATALLVGLVTDTLCFRTGNVTSRQLRTASRWVNAGASLSQVTELVYGRESLSTICLWGKALARVQTRGRIIWTEIEQDMLRQCGASPDEGNGLVSFLASTMGVDVAAVFREKDDGRIEASMRAGPGWDVSAVALQLGGGGHARAAGLSASGSLASVRETVLTQIEASLAEQTVRRAAAVPPSSGTVPSGEVRYCDGPHRNPTR
jgi:bifunctional oligoribonuclease and PAP phosphatase NrnA